MTYSDVGELGLNDPLNQGIGLRIDGRGGLIQKKHLAPSSERSHEGYCISAAITNEAVEPVSRSCLSPALKFDPSFATIPSRWNFSFKAAEEDEDL